MYARVGLAALAAGMMMTSPPAFGQATGGTRTPAPPRACAGDCPEQRAEVMRDLARARAELERLARTLSQQSDTLDARQLAVVREQLIETLARIDQLEQQTIRERVESRMMVARVRAPEPSLVREGWLGVSFSSNFEVIERPGSRRIFRFQAYPVVEAVEPASPARRAGIEVGDVLLAFQEKDLRKEPIELDALLTPGRRLPVLLRRGDATRTVTVTVGERPRGAYAMVAPTPAPPGVVRIQTGVSIPTPARAPEPPVATPEPRVWVFAPSTESVALAGAQMALLPAQLREQVGAEGGLLVLRVAHGTPAARAGLRDGDVIIAANGSPVRASGDLQKALRSADDRVMSLEVVRKREVMTVRMRW